MNICVTTSVITRNGEWYFHSERSNNVSERVNKIPLPASLRTVVIINIFIIFILFISGIFTGSVYYDSKANAMLSGSKLCPIGNVFIVKTHTLGNTLRRPKCEHTSTLNYHKAIYIIRNPYDTILAEFNRQNGGKVQSASKEAFNTPGTTKTIIYVSYRHWISKRDGLDLKL